MLGLRLELLGFMPTGLTVTGLGPPPPSQVAVGGCLVEIYICPFIQ